jgi:hypothetical protein
VHISKFYIFIYITVMAFLARAAARLAPKLLGGAKAVPALAPAAAAVETGAAAASTAAGTAATSAGLGGVGKLLGGLAIGEFALDALPIIGDLVGIGSGPKKDEREYDLLSKRLGFEEKTAGDKLSYEIRRDEANAKAQERKDLADAQARKDLLLLQAQDKREERMYMAEQARLEREDRDRLREQERQDRAEAMAAQEAARLVQMQQVAQQQAAKDQYERERLNSQIALQNKALALQNARMFVRDGQDSGQAHRAPSKVADSPRYTTEQRMINPANNRQANDARNYAISVTQKRRDRSAGFAVRSVDNAQELATINSPVKESTIVQVPIRSQRESGLKIGRLRHREEI